MTVSGRQRRALEAQEAARKRQEAADAAGEARIREMLCGTSWPEERRLPLTATERSHRYRAKGREIGTIPRAKNPFRVWACGLSLLQFGLSYFYGPDKMLQRRPSPRMIRFVEALEKTIRFGGNRHVRWPRGKGKSTWLKIAAVWALVYGYRRFVVVIAATKPMAEVAVDEIWKFCTEDPDFAGDFPEFAVPLADVALTPQRCKVQTYLGKKTHITENTKYAFKRFAKLDGFPNTGGIIAARGADQAIRGLNIDSRRPDFIFLDDPQTDEDAKSTGAGGRVDKIEQRIQGALLGLGETNRMIAAVMASTPIEPGDISDRFADPERHGEWLTTTEKLVVKFGPKEWVSAYLRELAKDNAAHDVLMARSRAWYIEHRDEIEAGVVMMDDQDFDPDLEVSAYQHALIRLHMMKSKAFYAECQMQPTRAQGVFRLEATKVSKQLNGYPSGVIPPQCDHGIVAFCDVNDIVGLRWEIMAFGSGRVTATLAYGRYPAEGRLYPEGTPLSAVASYLLPAMRQVASAIASASFVRQDGSAAKVSAICFDGGWQTETVALGCAEITKSKLIQAVWSKGYAAKQYSRNFHEKAKVTEGCRAAEECHTWITANGHYLAFNADYWKEVSQTSFLAPPLSPSSSSLWGSDSNLHYDYAAEVTAEQLESKVSDIRYGDIWKWKVLGDNHYGDTHVGCLVFGAIRGDFDPIQKLAAATVTEAAKQRKKVRYVFKGW